MFFWFWVDTDIFSDFISTIYYSVPIITPIYSSVPKTLPSHSPIPALTEEFDPACGFAHECLLVFLRQQSVPVGVLAELLLKQLVLTQRLSFSDLQILDLLATHERFGLGHAMKVLDILGQACFLNPVYAESAQQPFLKLLTRFSEEQGVVE